MRGEFLRECLVDPAGETRSARRFSRRRAIASAVTLEAGVILSLALYPLLTPAQLRPQIVNAPIPVRYGAPEVHRPATASPRTRFNREALFSPARVPAHIVRSPVANIRSEAPPAIENPAPGLPFGVSENPGSLENGLAAIAPPQPPVAPVRVIHRGEKLEEGQLVRRVMPQYPQIARLARISGTVELLVLIGQDGRVKSVEALSGSPMLAASAKAGVAQWRYRPAILEGQAVEVETRVTVHFVLNE